MGRPPLPHPVPRFQVLRHSPTPLAPPLLHKPSPHLGRLALQPQETIHPPPPQTGIRPLSKHRRHRSAHPLPKRRAARLHPSLCSSPSMRCHLHYQYALHRFPTLWIRHVVRHPHRHYMCVVLIQMVPSTHHTGRRMGLGTEKLRQGVGDRRWPRLVCRHRGME